MISIKQMKNKQLKDEYISAYETVYVIECYGTKDLLYLCALEKELGDRGIEIHSTVSFN